MVQLTSRRTNMLSRMRVSVLFLAVALLAASLNGCEQPGTTPGKIDADTPRPIAPAPSVSQEPAVATPPMESPEKAPDTSDVPSPNVAPSDTPAAAPEAAPVNPEPVQEAPAAATSEPAAIESKTEQAPEILVNGDFESGYDGWHLTNVTRTPPIMMDNEIKTKGAKSLKVLAPGGSSFDLVRWGVPIVSGRKYRLSGDLRTQDLKGEVYLIGASGKRGTPGSEWQWVSTRKLSGTNDWTKLDTTFEVPATSDFFFVRIDYRDKSTTDLQEGAFWADNLSLTEVQ
jgi:hypothetical protein